MTTRTPRTRTSTLDRVRKVLPRTSEGERLGIAGLALVAVISGLLLAFDASGDFLNHQNEPVVGLVFLLALIVATGTGYQLGRRDQGQISEATKEHLGQILAATFAVLGLLLAFTVAMAVSRFDARKDALLRETNAIGTVYQQAQLLDDPERTQVQTLLRQYVDARLASERPLWYEDKALTARTSQLQDQIWAQTVGAARANPQSVPIGLFVQSVGSMFDAQSARDEARTNLLPGSLIYLLFTSAVLAMAILGYHAGTGNGRSVLGTLMLALLLTVVMVIILDLDRPYRGLITVSPQGLIDLRNAIGSGSPYP